MHLLHALSETALGRALLAYVFDLPRWTLANILFTVALVPAYLAFSYERWFVAGIATLPAVTVLAGMINLASGQVAGNAPRLRDVLAYPATLPTVCIAWIGTIIAQLILVESASLVVIFATGIMLFSLLMIGVFAIYMPSQLKVNGLLIWRNALVLAVSNPIVALGLLLLGVAGMWAVWVSQGAMIVVIPALWVVLAAFTVNDRIETMQAEAAPLSQKSTVTRAD